MPVPFCRFARSVRFASSLWSKARGGYMCPAHRRKSKNSLSEAFSDHLVEDFSCHQQIPVRRGLFKVNSKGGVCGLSLRKRGHLCVSLDSVRFVDFWH